MPFTATHLRAEACALSKRAETVRAGARESTDLRDRARRYELADDLERQSAVMLLRAQRAEERASTYRLTRPPVRPYGAR